MQSIKFTDSPRNPLIEPPGWEWLIADPSVLTPNQTPDGQWALFANSLRGIHLYTSPDGITWTKRGNRLFSGLRACVHCEEDCYYMFYERFLRPWYSVVAVRQSSDLWHWSEPQTLLEPQYSWEGSFLKMNPCPCLVKGPFGYRLYFSASAIFLKDCCYIEPKHIGMAESDAILGPYHKHPRPLISPDLDDPYRNFGAGAMKVLYEDGRFWAFNNGIYFDKKGKSRSALRLLTSDDGFRWQTVSEKPLIAPEWDSWKQAFVYACDVVRYRGEWRLYYNARDGWLIGRERIGLAIGS